jgi:cysteine synthase A
MGNTPLIKLKGLTEKNDAEIYVKLEHLNPTGTHKVRAYLNMIKKIEQNTKITRNTIFVEASSGNSAIAGAFICAIKGYKFKAFIPNYVSRERSAIAKCYGADIVLSKMKTPSQHKEQALKFVDNDPQYRIFINQYDNQANPESFEVVGKELYEFFNSQKIIPDYFLSGAGTYGLITGVSTTLKMYYPNLKTILIESPSSPYVYAKRNNYKFIYRVPKLTGMGGTSLPKVVKENLYDLVDIANEKDAIKMTRKLARIGLFVGKTSGANIDMAIKYAKKIGKGKIIITNTFDSGERYLSENIW